MPCGVRGGAVLGIAASLALLSLSACSESGGGESGGESVGVPLTELTGATAAASQGISQTLGGVLPAAYREQVFVDSAEPDLFPELGAAGVVFIRSQFDETQLAEGQEPQSCLKCAYCTGCSWQVVLKGLQAGATEAVLADSTGLEASPLTHGTKVVWMHAETGTRMVEVYDTTSQTIRQVTAGSAQYIETTPEIRGDTLYWYGYMPYSGAQGLIAADVATGESRMLFVANMHRPYFSVDGAAQRFGRRQPFAMDDTRVVWAEWQDGSVAIWERRLDAALGEPPVRVASDADWDYIHPAVNGATIAWKAYGRTEGCYDQKCDLHLEAEIAGHPLTAPSVHPSRYSGLRLAGPHAYWTDFRDGAYAVYRRDLTRSDGADQRLTSGEAVISAGAAPAVYGNTMVWMDYRNGNWDLYRRPL